MSKFKTEVKFYMKNGSVITKAWLQDTFEAAVIDAKNLDRVLGMHTSSLEGDKDRERSFYRDVLGFCVDMADVSCFDITTESEEANDTE